MQGRVFVISGPSGVGKSTLIQVLLAEDPSLEMLVSSTTRAPRDGERNGYDYYFVNHECFQSRINEQAFLEWAQVYDNYYGTTWGEVERVLSAGHHAVVDVDTQGAKQIREATRGAVYIMITPPSLEVLFQRLRMRGTETDVSLVQRMSRAEHELEHKDLYDHLIVNNKVDAAVSHLQGIVGREKARSVLFQGMEMRTDR